MGTLNPGTLSFRTVIRHNPHLYPKLDNQLHRIFSLFPVAYSLFPIPYSLFPVPCSLFPIPYSLFPIPYSLKS
ncbi:MAG: hypothetical protein F6J90_29695 [Moorea sp. SIOASIH]|uniref:hypothetical protein n=1 Tax=Moorena sp. SIOASIH TaxID=2607817 RepID=UPI0013BB672D|nr:hypothetical protein [Moorena sp. SIOASIH]NEO40293.1 hypothetical protein [Moorena sp. SIOASIH]